MAGAVTPSEGADGGSLRFRPLRRYVEAPWGLVHLAQAGSEFTGRRPTMVCVHQTPRSWDEFAEILAIEGRRRPVVALDLPGMGASDPPDGEFTIEALAAAVIVVIDDLAVGPVDLVGHHTGGVVALACAARRPELIRSLVLSSTPWVDAAARRRRAGKARMVDEVDGWDDGSHGAALWAGREAFYPRDRPDLLRRFVADALHSTDPAAGHRAVGAFRMEEVVPLVPRCPTLIVRHARDPHAAGEAEPLLRALPHARIAELADGMVPLEFTAHEFAELVGAFSDGIDPSDAVTTRSPLRKSAG